MTAAGVVTEIRQATFDEDVATCSRHPDKNVRESIRGFIADNNKAVPPDWKCRGGG
jgi:hypothetical protein